MTKTANVARDYVRRGWSPIPIPPKAKRPTVKNWQKLRLTEEDIAHHFNGASNVGVLLGEPSGWLIDVDLDHRLALELADKFLPPTQSEFGRESARRSHRLYYVTGPVETHQRRFPKVNGKAPMIVELRSTGAQTVFPGSVHPEGEQIEWDSDGEPARVAPDDLLAAVNSLANEVERRKVPKPEAVPTAEASGDVVDRARRYLAKIPPAISGQGGHDATFRAACRLVLGFALDRDTALLLLSEWNQGCVPPWSAKELAHKVDDAFNLKFSRGNLLVEPFVPFPVDALPEPVCRFVTVGAKAIGCDPVYLALPILTVLAAAIGNARRIELKRGWTAPAILWTAIVGESGTAKTPALRLALRAIRERQRKALKRHADRKPDKTCETRCSSEAQQVERFIVNDTTVEALAPLLLTNPRGLLLACDELAGWFGSFDRYAGGKAGADAAHWLSMHSGEHIIVDRKTGAARTIFVPQASVCVCGGIQPKVLHRALGAEHRESGLAARLLLTYPPRTEKHWSDEDIEESDEAEIASLIDRLYELQPICDDEGELSPVVVELSPEAKETWVSFYNEHAHEQTALAGELAAAWSKLEEYAARLALVIHFIRWAANDPTLTSLDVVDAASMAAGIRLVTWFKGEARRVYALLADSDEDRDARQLVEWIARRGGSVTSRTVQQGCRWLKKPGAAESALDSLVKAGRGHWRDSPATAKGGRPARVFELSKTSTVNGTLANTNELLGFVDVDAVGEVKAATLNSESGEAQSSAKHGRCEG